MKLRILIALAVTLLIGGVMIAGLAFLPRGIVNRAVSVNPNDTTALQEKAAEFAGALQARKTRKLYELFNSTFQAEVPFADFDSSVLGWLGHRVITHVYPVHFEIRSVSGMVNSYLTFDPRSVKDRVSRYPEEFLFQYWIRTASGWRLMWLSKMLDPVAMNYAHTDTAAMCQILRLALSRIITDRGLQDQLGTITTPHEIVLRSGSAAQCHVDLPGRKVTWLSLDSIVAARKTLGVNFFIEIPSVRIFEDVAIGTFDIVPLVFDTFSLSHRRSIKLMFTRDSAESNDWQFADYGMKW